MWIERNEEYPMSRSHSQALADAVAWTTRVIDARPATPILAGIRLEAIDGTLQLSAFNYAISARHHIEAGVDEAGSVLVLGKLLADITKSLPAAKTYLSTDGSTMTITSGKSTFTMQLMPESEYPDLPVVPTKLGQVDSPTFAQAVNQASVAVSREENRPVLTGIRVQFQGDKVIMSSTDRFRLARSQLHLDARRMRPSAPPLWSVARCCATCAFAGRASERHHRFRCGQPVPAGLRERRPRVHLPAHRRRIPGR